MATIFERIARGELPAHRVYEDEHVVAFLDIQPVARGHVLVIPRKGYRTLDAMPAKAAAAVGAALPRVAAAVQRATGCVGYNVLQNNGEAAGQAVPHVHFHIIPRYDARKDAFSYDWPAGELGDEEAAELREAIASAVPDAAP